MWFDPPRSPSFEQSTDFELSTEDTCLDDNSVVENVVREEIWDDYKLMTDVENALKSVINGGHSMENAARTFDVNLDYLESFHKKVYSLLSSDSRAKGIVASIPTLIQSDYTQKRYYPVTTRPESKLSNRPAILNHTRVLDSKGRWVIRLVKPPLDGSTPRHVSISGARVEVIVKNLEDIEDIENFEALGAGMKSNVVIVPDGTMNYNSDPTISMNSLYPMGSDHPPFDMNESIEEEIDVTSFDGIDSYYNTNTMFELEEATTMEENNLMTEGSVMGSGSMIEGYQDSVMSDSFGTNMIEKSQTEVNEALVGICERSYLPERELESIRMALRELLTDPWLPITSVSNAYNINRARLSSFFSKLRKKLDLPPKRDNYILRIIDSPYVEEVVVKASREEIRSLVEQKLVNCHSEHRSRMERAVMRVVLGQATPPQSAEDNNLHPLSVWRYATMIRNDMGERAPKWKKTMRPPMKRGRRQHVVFDRYGQRVNKIPRKKKEKRGREEEVGQEYLQLMEMRGYENREVARKEKSIVSNDDEEDTDESSNSMSETEDESSHSHTTEESNVGEGVWWSDNQ